MNNAPSGLLPDYGTRLVSAGHQPRETVVEFFNVEISNMMVVDHNDFTTLIEYDADGAWHAVSLDYGSDFLKFLLDHFPSDAERHALLSHQPVMPYLFRTPVQLKTLTLVLADPAQTAQESFVPFGVTKATTEERVFEAVIADQ